MTSVKLSIGSSLGNGVVRTVTPAAPSDCATRRQVGPCLLINAAARCLLTACINAPRRKSYHELRSRYSVRIVEVQGAATGEGGAVGAGDVEDGGAFGEAPG